MAVRPKETQTLGLALDGRARKSVRCNLSVPAAVARSEVVVGYGNDPAHEQAMSLTGRHLAGVEERGVLVIVAGMKMRKELLVVALRDPR